MKQRVPVLGRWLVALLAVVVLVGVAGTSQSTAQQSGSYFAYLPVSIHQPVSRSIFGVEMSSATQARGLDGAVALHGAWLRRNALLWNEIEPTEGNGYNWAAPSVQVLEQEMIEASRRGVNIILIVRGSPAWATAPYGSDCAPIDPAKYAQFANFLAAAVERYSRAPYNVLHWEIGNEPDTAVNRTPAGAPYGCWGDPNDPYFGGRAYGAMLNTVYPVIKHRNPSIKVLNGGLNLEQPYNPQIPRSLAARFLEGVFLAGAGNSFDMLAYHSYCYNTSDTRDADGLYLYPQSRSCAFEWKVGYLRDLMQRYGVVTKPLINTEGALLCWSGDLQTCRARQADYIPRQIARSMKDGVQGYVWYSYDYDGFFNTALVNPAAPAQQRASYFAAKQASIMLNGTLYGGQLTGQPSGVEGYQFRGNSGETITIVWANSAQNITVRVPQNAAVQCRNRDGGAVACSNAGGAVRFQAQPSPVYLIVR